MPSSFNAIISPGKVLAKAIVPKPPMAVYRVFIIDFSLKKLRDDVTMMVAKVGR